MLTPALKVWNASWSSAICSTLIPAAMQATTVCTVSAEYSPGTCAPRMVRDRRSAVSLQKPSDPAVGGGAQRVAVTGDADDWVVVLGGLGLGEAYPAIFGVGE